MSYALAERAIDFNCDYVVNDSDWEYLGAGVSRVGYLHKPTATVYKVPFGLYTDNSRINYEEAAASAYLRENYKIPGIIWPEFTIHNIAAAWISEVAYFENDSEMDMNDPRYQWINTLFMSLGMNDLWINHSNVKFCKGFVIPIDLGYWALTEERPWEHV